MIYLADGESVWGYAAIAESSVQRGTSRPAIIVGIPSAAGATVHQREYWTGHVRMMWDLLFAEGITLLLPPRK